MADVALNLLIQNLISMISAEFKLLRGFEDARSRLQKSLILSQKYLSDAEEKEIGDREVKKWLKDLEDVVFQADDVLDKLKYHQFHNNLKNDKQETKKVLCSSSFGFSNLRFRSNMATKINDLNCKFNNVNQEAKIKGLRERVVTAPDASTVGLDDQETDSYYDEPYVVGRNTDVTNIVKMMLNAPQEHKISVLPIVGMGGLGKTTLARQICQHKKIKSRFEKKIWICVSLNSDKLTLFRNMYTILSEKSVESHSTTEYLLQKIHKLLKGKRFLMILDDVWNKDPTKWEDFLKSLLGICTATQNLIIVTTRDEHVAELVKTLPLYKLTSLSHDDCWSIIKAKTLCGIDDQLEYEGIGKEFARNCYGLPLAAHVIGGMLSSKAKEEWSSIMNELLNHAQNDDNHILRILKVSYNRLPSSLLKKCFVYSSVYPKDFEFNKNTLIEQWLGEGFLQTNQENVSMEAIGNKIFNHLVHVSLFQESKRDLFGNITYCKMHDFVHDLARSLSRGGSGGGTCKDSGNDLSKVRYMYLQSREPHEISKEDAKYLRTLIVDGKYADNMFRDHLRVLTLKGSGIQDLPVKIEKQIHMRFLDISETRIKKLPDSINKLSNLQTLVVEQLQTLPNTITDLLNLRHLYISSIELPPFIGKLTSLQTLPYYLVGHDRGCRIGELENLKNLKGTLEISNLERVKGKREAEHADLFGKSGILTLVLDWSTGTREGDEDVLDGLQPHSNLKSLKIRGYGSINFPSWTMEMTVHRSKALTNLINIEITNCQCKRIPSLGHLPCLKFLKFEKLPAIQSIDLSLDGLETTTPVFPALEKLWLSHMGNLTKWVNIESGVATFPCLETLEILYCPKLETAPTCFPRLKDLCVQKIGSNFPLAKICANTSSLQSLDIDSYPGELNFGDECFVKNRDLSYLSIRDCPNMICISRRRSKFKSIWKPKLHNYDLKLLETLSICRCESLTCLPHGLLESGTPSLVNLSLYSLPELENMDTVMSCISRLDVLDLVDLPKWTNLPVQILQLRKLRIGGFSQLIDADSFNDYLKFTLHESYHRLEFLEIYGNEEWTSLPDIIEQFHALEFLSVEDYGIQALPEWIGELSSLQELVIWNCKKLHHLPSRETMQRLTELCNLRIHKCPLLTEKFRTQQETTPDDADSSEWSKISHIKDVRIDGVPWHQNSTSEGPLVKDKNKFSGCFSIQRNRKL